MIRLRAFKQNQLLPKTSCFGPTSFIPHLSLHSSIDLRIALSTAPQSIPGWFQLTCKLIPLAILTYRKILRYHYVRCAFNRNWIVESKFELLVFRMLQIRHISYQVGFTVVKRTALESDLSSSSVPCIIHQQNRDIDNTSLSWFCCESNLKKYLA